MVSQYFWFTPLGINGLLASRALCHEESAFHNLLVSGLEKDIFFSLKFLSLCCGHKSQCISFRPGWSGTPGCHHVRKKALWHIRNKVGKVLNWGSCSWRGVGVSRFFGGISGELNSLECAWNMHLRELDLSSAVCNLACGRGFDLQFWTALGTLW